MEYSGEHNAVRAGNMKYYADVAHRYKVQTVAFLVQFAVAELMSIFTLAWVGSLFQSVNDAMMALMFTFFGLYLAVYAAQLIFASVTYKKIEQKSKRDVVFLVFSIISAAFAWELWQLHTYLAGVLA